MSGDFLERAAELRRQGQAFVLATVVRSQRPASARPGDAGLLVAGGRLEGWVGGGCVQSCIEREARQTLEDGLPRLVRLSPEPRDEEGVTSYPMTCHSGGTLETDPVCGMAVEVAMARWTAERDGAVYYFCSPGCRRVFLAG